MRARLSSPVVEQALGGLRGRRIRLLRRGLRAQAAHGRAMREGGGVYYRESWWTEKLGCTPKQLEHDFAALAELDLVDAEWLARVDGRTGATRTRRVRTFAPHTTVNLDAHVPVVQCTPEAERRAAEILAAKANHKRGGARPGAGRHPKICTCPKCIRRAAERAATNSKPGERSGSKTTETIKARGAATKRGASKPKRRAPLGNASLAEFNRRAPNKTPTESVQIPFPDSQSLARWRAHSPSEIVGVEHADKISCGECFAVDGCDCLDRPEVNREDRDRDEQGTTPADPTKRTGSLDTTAKGGPTTGLGDSLPVATDEPTDQVLEDHAPPRGRALPESPRPCMSDPTATGDERDVEQGDERILAPVGNAR